MPCSTGWSYLKAPAEILSAYFYCNCFWVEKEACMSKKNSATAVQVRICTGRVKFCIAAGGYKPLRRPSLSHLVTDVPREAADGKMPVGKTHKGF